MSLRDLYSALKDAGEAGFSVVVSGERVEVVGSEQPPVDLLGRLRAVKGDLLGFGTWRPAEHRDLWPRSVWDAYAYEVGAAADTATEDAVYRRYAKHNVVVVEGADVHAA